MFVWVSSETKSGQRCLFTESDIAKVVENCPDLQEICFKDTIGSVRISVVRPFRGLLEFTHSLLFAQVDTKPVESLRSLKHLAVVDLDFTTSPFYPDENGTPKNELYRTQAETDLKVWKGYLIEVLKDSPSEERKFLRWKVCKTLRQLYTSGGAHVVLEEGELEVFPETII